MPAIVGITHPEAVVDLAVSRGSGLPPRYEIATWIEHFALTADGTYGYLAWRYSTTLHLLRSGVTTPADEIATIAQVIDAEKRTIDAMVRTHNVLLQKPERVASLIEEDFRELADNDDIGTTAEDEMRRVRARESFLMRARVMLIANPGIAPRLWEMLQELPPLDATQLTETTPRLITATARLAVDTQAVEEILCTEDTVLNQFLRTARTEVVELHSGRYDGLIQFRDKSPSEQGAARLDFEVLPRGEKLHAFIENLRTTRRFNGYPVDYRRLTVLQEIEANVGPDRCQWHIGAASSEGVNNQYLVLTIRAPRGEHAVAISPLAGKHATYVVRAGGEDWRVVLSRSKTAARASGAVRLLFTPRRGHDGDEYAAMRDRVISLINRPLGNGVGTSNELHC